MLTAIMTQNSVALSRGEPCRRRPVVRCAVGHGAGGRECLRVWGDTAGHGIGRRVGGICMAWSGAACGEAKERYTTTRAGGNSL